jgi:ribose 5-phosphate isomerase RpiB
MNTANQKLKFCYNNVVTLMNDHSSRKRKSKVKPIIKAQKFLVVFRKAVEAEEIYNDYKKKVEEYADYDVPDYVEKEYNQVMSELGALLP